MSLFYFFNVICIAGQNLLKILVYSDLFSNGCVIFSFTEEDFSDRFDRFFIAFATNCSTCMIGFNTII
jgi:hypothetical protein